MAGQPLAHLVERGGKRNISVSRASPIWRSHSDSALGDLSYLSGSDQLRMGHWFSLLNTHSRDIVVNEESGSTSTLLSLVIYTWELAAT